MPFYLSFYFIESRSKNIIRSFNFEKNLKKNIALIYIQNQILFKEHKGYLEDFINLGKDKEIPVVIMNIPAITNFDNYPYKICK